MTARIIEANLIDVNNVGSDQEVNDLKYEILHLSKIEQSASYTNDGCWRGIQNLKNINFLLEEIKKQIKIAIEYYASKDFVFKQQISDNFKIHYWINVNKPGSRNVLHSHKPGVFSGVYYIQGSETGDLRIVNPANILGECNNQSPFTRDFFFTPKDKDLIIWPSWLPHEVEPNLSNRDRINIAFDVRFINES